MNSHQTPDESVSTHTNTSDLCEETSRRLDTINKESIQIVDSKEREFSASSDLPTDEGKSYESAGSSDAFLSNPDEPRADSADTERVQLTVAPESQKKDLTTDKQPASPGQIPPIVPPPTPFESNNPNTPPTPFVAGKELVQAAELKRCNALSFTATIGPLVSLFFGGMFLSLGAFVCAVIGYLRSSRMLKDETLDSKLKVGFSNVKTQCSYAMVISAMVAISQAIYVYQNFPAALAEYSPETYTELFGEAPPKPNTTWG